MSCYTDEDLEDYEKLAQQRQSLHDIYQDALRDAFTTVTSQFRAVYASLSARKRLCKAICSEVKRRVAVVKQSVLANLLAIQRREYAIFVQRVRMDAQYCRQLKMQARESHRILLFAAHLDAETESEVQLQRLSPPREGSQQPSALHSRKDSEQYLRCKRAVLDNVRPFFFPSSREEKDAIKGWHGLSVLDIFKISHSKMLRRFQGLQHKMQIVEANISQTRKQSKDGSRALSGKKPRSEHHGTKGLFCRVSAESIPKLVAYGFGPIQFTRGKSESLYSISQSADPSTQEGVDSLFSGVAPFFATLHRHGKPSANDATERNKNVMGKFAMDAASTANPVFLPAWFSRSSTLESDREWVRTGKARKADDLFSHGANTQHSETPNHSLSEAQENDNEDEESLGLGTDIPFDLLDAQPMQEALAEHWPGAKDLNLAKLHTRFSQKRERKRKEYVSRGYSYKRQNSTRYKTQENAPHSSDIQYLALCRVLLGNVVEVDKVTPEIVEEHLDAAMQAEKSLVREDTRKKASSYSSLEESMSASEAFSSVDALYDKSREEYLILRPSCVLPEFMIQFTFSKNTADLDAAREKLFARSDKHDLQELQVVDDETFSSAIDLSMNKVTQSFPYWIGTVPKSTDKGSSEQIAERPMTPYQSPVALNYSAALNQLYPSPAASLQPSPGEFLKWTSLGAQSVNVSQSDIENAQVSPYMYLHVLRHVLAHIPGPMLHTFSPKIGVSYLQTLRKLSSESFDEQNISSNSLRDTEIALDWKALHHKASQQRIHHVAGAMNAIEKSRKAIKGLVKALFDSSKKHVEEIWTSAYSERTADYQGSYHTAGSSHGSSKQNETEDESPAAEEARMLRNRVEELQCALWREKAQTAEIRAQNQVLYRSLGKQSERPLPKQASNASGSKHGGTNAPPSSAESTESKSALPPDSK